MVRYDDGETKLLQLLPTELARHSNRFQSYFSKVPSEGVKRNVVSITTEFLAKTITIYNSGHQELPATSAARCLIISITAALRRESDCCCSLLRCSFKSLQRGTVHSDSLHARA